MTNKETINNPPNKITLYCVRCKADYTAINEKKYFPRSCPSCHRDTHWTKTPDLDDNDDYWKEKKHNSAYKYFDSDGRFIPKRLGDEILGAHWLITMEDTEETYIYGEGIYHSNGESFIKKEIQKKLGEETTTHRVNEVLDYIKRETFIERGRVNHDSDLICLENGIFNLQTKTLVPHTPEKIFLNKIQVRYNPEADCPKIKQFIEEIVHRDDYPVLQEVTGYCLNRDYPIQKAVMLLGEGANGKSTFLRLLTLFLGKHNIASVPLQELEYNRFASAALYGKLANLYADLPDKALSHTGTFKMLTGGDPVPAEIKFKNKFNFKNIAKLIFSCNRLPLSKDDTPAFYRRWVLINFPKKFEGKNKDLFILEKITTEEELSGLLNWALEGLGRLLKQGEFSHSRTTDELRKKYIALSNSVLAFVEECLIPDPDGQIPKDELYQTYCEYCRENNLPIKQQNVLSRELPGYVRITEERPKIDGKRTRCWRGVKYSEVGINYRSSMSVMSKEFPILGLYDYYSNNKNREKPGQVGQGGPFPISSKITNSMEKHPPKDSINFQEVKQYEYKHK